MTVCDGIDCQKWTVWVYRYNDGMEITRCNKHMVQYDSYRDLASVPAGSPQLTLSEVTVLCEC